ncbi:MAG: peptide chain release factor N(5)-glutamine methyltransferase [Thermoguttaceae bacterium]|nr:peptide chain release factor N(5)-glutamine methyltransferase [Thermoguttaceae bacterium]
MSTELWTTRRLLEWTADYFKGRGIENPRLEVELLLATALHTNRVGLYLRYDEVPTDPERTAFRELVKRRAAGEPSAYLIGHKDFYSLDFDVNADVLIPRPETETLVLEGVEFLRARAKENAGFVPRVLDIGTGSGALAVALARNLPAARLVAVDISAPALAMAKKNAEKHSVADRIEFRESDLFAAVGAGERFDLIVSNPPYVSQSEYDALDRSVRDFEPRIALLSGEKGTEIVARIVADAPAHLEPGGRLLIEISPMIAEASLEFFQDSPFIQFNIINDYAGLKRVILAEIE